MNNYMDKDTICGFITNSSNYYNKRSMKFRKMVLNIYDLISLYDLADVKNITFGIKSEPSSIIIFKQKTIIRIFFLMIIL